MKGGIDAVKVDHPEMLINLKAAKADFASESGMVK